MKLRQEGLAGSQVFASLARWQINMLAFLCPWSPELASQNLLKAMSDTAKEGALA